jgi:hypothetical protein
LTVSDAVENRSPAGLLGCEEEVESMADNGRTEVQRAVVGVVRGDDVNMSRAGAGVVLARHDISMTQGGGGPIVAGGDVSFRQGGGGPVLARGNVTLEQGLMKTVLAGGDVRVGDRGFVGIALAPRLTVEPGGRVMMTVRQAAAFGAVVGLVAGAVLRIRRRDAL